MYISASRTGATRVAPRRGLPQPCRSRGGIAGVHSLGQFLLTGLRLRRHLGHRRLNRLGRFGVRGFGVSACWRLSIDRGWRSSGTLLRLRLRARLGRSTRRSRRLCLRLRRRCSRISRRRSCLSCTCGLRACRLFRGRRLLCRLSRLFFLSSRNLRRDRRRSRQFAQSAGAASRIPRARLRSAPGRHA